MNSENLENDPLAEYIPPNRGKNKRIMGIRKRNWIEGAVEVVLIDGMILLIPFVPKLKLVLVIIVTFFILLLNAVGYRDKAWLELLVQWIKYKLGKKCYRLRSPADDDGKNRIETAKSENPYIQKLAAYFSDSNLNVENPDSKRILAKLAKDIFKNFWTNFDLFED